MKHALATRTARTLLTLLFVGTLAVTAWNVWHFMTSAGGRFLVERTQSVVESRLTEIAFKEVDQTMLEREISTQLDAEPRNWVVIHSLEEIADQRDFILSDPLLDELNQAGNEDHSIAKTAADCAACTLDASTCEISAVMFCGIAVDMTPIGDVASLARAGTDYWNGDDVDEIDTALSVVGLGATALGLATAGTSLPVKTGAGFLKFAHRAGNIPPSIARVLKKAAVEGIDWAHLRSVRSTDDLAAVVRMKAFRPAADAATSIGTIVDRTGIQQGMYLLKTSENASDLRPIKGASEVWEKQTTGYLSMLGKSRVTKLTMRYADEVYGLVVGFLGMLLSFGGAILSGVGNVVLRRLRRLSRRNATG